MTETSRPWNGTVTGDAGPYTDAQWQALYRGIIGYGAGRVNNGVFLQSGTEPEHGLKVTEASPNAASVLVLPGSALVQGIAYINSANVTLSIAANSSGNPRIDTIILRADYALQTVRLAVLQGTAAASPVAPSLTQSAGTMWEIPIADIAVANGFTTIVNANITQRQEWVNAPGGVYLDSILNNSGAIRNTGDVVINDTSADRAATTTTSKDVKNVLGVWQGKTAIAGRGKVLRFGIGYVQTDAAVTRGDILVTATTAGKATKVATGEAGANCVIGTALETTSGAGLALCLIHVRNVRDYDIAQYQDQKTSGTAGGSTVATTWTKHTLNTEIQDTGNFGSISGDVLTLLPGTYTIWWSMAFGTVVARSRLRNTSDGTTVNQSPSGANSNVSGSAYFTITSSKNFEFQYYASAVVATTGLGSALTSGDVEVYLDVLIRREGETP